MTYLSTHLDLQKTLGDLGLDERETSVYLSLLEQGPQLPQHIARHTGIKRTTLYEIFPILASKELIIEVRQGKRRLFQAVPPDRILRNFENKYKEIKQNISGLNEIYLMQGLKPKIDIYEGFNGIKKLYLKTLETKETMRNYVQMSKNNHTVLDWLVREYVPMRVKRGIEVKAIVPMESETDVYMPIGDKYLRQTRKVPWKKFPFKIECMILGDKLFFATYEKGKPLVGIIIESKQIATTQAALFDLAWEGAEKYQR